MPSLRKEISSGRPLTKRRAHSRKRDETSLEGDNGGHHKGDAHLVGVGKVAMSVGFGFDEAGDCLAHNERQRCLGSHAQLSACTKYRVYRGGESARV